MNADDPLKLWSYWIEVHYIYKQCRQIIIDELLKNQNGDIAIRFRMPGRRIKVKGE